MSQNHLRYEQSRTGSELPLRRNLVLPVTAAIREQQPLDTDLPAVVLSSVADRLPWLSTPDVLELRAQVTVDVDEAVPLVERVATIIDAILTEVEHWKQGASA
ncbi:hypothetical protein EGH22_20305 [Halomicroarcula sp. F28]|uniref:hypothetical protein n=1 Tax=Haloarcula salinisoli TaxID=2487746 RepID=UPI001C73B2BB|nr:hypothetical protein [Halomicroarcula salinisoli]MBX0288676.1 hypothetical protein [Halomicroarcula salinisoli]